LARAVETLKTDLAAEGFRALQSAMVQFNSAKAGELRRTSDQLTLHLTAGNDFLAKGAYAGAEQEFRAALTLDSSSAAAHAGLARVYAEKHQWPDAKREADAALAVDPANTEARQVAARSNEQAQPAPK
jgi:Tfp pilus assembly protein PilF